MALAINRPTVKNKPVRKLSPEDKHARMLHWFQSEMRRQQANRFQMSMDEDYYDSEQWTYEEAAEVRARGQNPVVYNEVKTTVDWLIGIERRTRQDFNVQAREDSKEAEADAKCKTKLLKYIHDANRSGFEQSNAADDTFKAGLGWIEIGISPDPEDEPIYKRSESWRNMLYDSLGTKKDLSDSRYLFRFRPVDLDLAIAYFPEKEKELRKAAVSGDDAHYMEWWNNKRIEEMETQVTPMTGKWTMYDSDAWSRNLRERVLLIECWYTEPTTETTGQGSAAVDRVRMKMRCAILTEQDLIADSPSPYNHNKFPFVPYWCYRRKKDNAPYGPIRPVRGPQDSLNKRHSKALFILSTNQTIAEADAFDDEVMTSDEARDEFQAPDGFILLAKGGLAKVKTNRETDVAQGHLQLAQADSAAIRNSVGATMDTLGRDTGVKQSGIALQRKAEQGSQLTAEIFDNQLFARQLEGELEVSLIEQFYTQPKVFAVTGERSKREYTRINQPDPVTGERLNDVTRFKTDFHIGEQAWRQTLNQAAFESLMELMTQMAPAAPQVVMAVLPSLFELADIPNKAEIVRNIRQAVNQPDPDEEESPEDAAAREEQQALAKKQVMAQMAQLDAQIRESEAKGKELDAKTLKTTLEALYVAMQSAQVITQAPGVTSVADELLKSAGFEDKAPGMPVVPDMAPADPMAQQPMDPMAVDPMAADPALMPTDQLTAPAGADGAMTGIETQAPDGVLPQ